MACARRHGWLWRLGREQGGNVATLFALTLVPLIAGTGLAIDSMLAFTVEERLQKALDAAGLAAGRTTDPSNIVADARSFFHTNFDDRTAYGSAGDPTVTVTDDADGQTITLTGSATSPTHFMRIFGIKEITVGARSEIRRATRGVELVMVLDNTYSMMSSSKITGLKTAANDMLDILFGNNETVRNLWVGLVPYIAAVNVGTGNTGFLAATDRVRQATNAYAPESWGGCVIARAAPRDQNDDPPGTAPFSSYLYPVVSYSGLSASLLNTWPPVDRREAVQNGIPYRVGDSPNAGCPTPIVPLISRKSTLKAAIAGLRPEERGGTITSEGIVWGWRAISPRWRGLWAGGTATLPLDYGTRNMDKVMVVLTDGDNQLLVTQLSSGGFLSPYAAYESFTSLGVVARSASQATSADLDEIDKRTTAVCTAIKAKGIKIYTITFGSAPSTRGQNLMRGCATATSMYFHSPDNATLRTVFRKIGNELANLRIAR